MPFDMASLMGLFGSGGQPGAAPTPQQPGMGFGLGQQMMAPPPQPGGMNQYANVAPGNQQPGMMEQLQGMFGGAPGQPQDPNGMASKLGPLAQMMAMHQMQQQQQGGGMMGGMNMMGPRAGQQGGTQAQRGYLAQGGGIAPRRIIGGGQQ